MDLGGAGGVGDRFEQDVDFLDVCHDSALLDRGEVLLEHGRPFSGFDDRRLRRGQVALPELGGDATMLFGFAFSKATNRQPRVGARRRGLPEERVWSPRSARATKPASTVRWSWCSFQSPGNPGRWPSSTTG
jgi:hypothetical protein